MDMKTLTTFQKERQLTDKTMETYKTTIKHYEQLNQQTIEQLIQEADQEEEQGIRPPNRNTPTTTTEQKTSKNKQTHNI